MSTAPLSPAPPQVKKEETDVLSSRVFGTIQNVASNTELPTRSNSFAAEDIFKDASNVLTGKVRSGDSQRPSSSPPRARRLAPRA